MDEVAVVEKPKHPKGKQPRPFAIQVDRARVRKAIKREDLARLVAVEGLTLAKAAEEMGISSRWAEQLWREAKAAAMAEDLSSEELKQEIRIQAVAALRQAQAVAMEHLDDTAAYGAVLVAATKALLEMHGCAKPDEEGNRSGESIEEVLRRAKVKSPLVLTRLGVEGRDDSEEATGVAPVEVVEEDV